MYLGKCLYNLKMIASVAPGQRMCTRDEYISQEVSTSSTGAYRWRTDGRDKMLTRVQDIVHATIEISDRVIESKYLTPADNESLVTTRMRLQRVHELRTIWEHLGNAKLGISGQTQTYPGDAKIGHETQKLVACIDEARTRIRVALQTIGENVHE